MMSYSEVLSSDGDECSGSRHWILWLCAWPFSVYCRSRAFKSYGLILCRIVLGLLSAGMTVPASACLFVFALLVAADWMHSYFNIKLVATYSVFLTLGLGLVLWSSVFVFVSSIHQYQVMQVLNNECELICSLAGRIKIKNRAVENNWKRNRVSFSV